MVEPPGDQGERERRGEGCPVSRQDALTAVEKESARALAPAAQALHVRRDAISADDEKEVHAQPAVSAERLELHHQGMPGLARADRVKEQDPERGYPAPMIQRTVRARRGWRRRWDKGSEGKTHGGRAG